MCFSTAERCYETQARVKDHGTAWLQTSSQSTVSLFHTRTYACCHHLTGKSCRLFVIPWDVAHQAPLSMEFSRQEYWSGFSFPPAGNLPNPRIEPKSPTSAGGFLTTEPPGKPSHTCIHTHKTQTGNWTPSESIMLDDMCFISIKVGKSMCVTFSESQVKSELHIGKNLGKQGTSSLRHVSPRCPVIDHVGS